MLRRRRVPVQACALTLALYLLAACGTPASQAGSDTRSASHGTAALASTSTTPTVAATAPTPIPRTDNPPDLILSTTTSTQDSGLLDALIPRFEQQTGYRVKTVAVGSGAAIALGQRGEADVVLAHAPENERQLVDSGAGINRQIVMYNDFIIVGPPGDPARVRGIEDVRDILHAIARAGATFVSRGDNSGTHQLEKKLWEAAGVTPQGQAWYVESGSGMGQTLQIADQRTAYTLSDRATYLAFKERITLTVAAEGDPRLLNIYHVIAVNPERFPRVNGEGAEAFIEFLLAPQTQQLIGSFGRETFGQALFTACAKHSCRLQNADD